MIRNPMQLCSSLLLAAALGGCYGTIGPDGAQPYGAAGTGTVIPAAGQEIVHDYGRSCYINCGGKDYFANCPPESKPPASAMRSPTRCAGS